MSEDNARYEEWLTTIANTRLVYNTMEELEQFYDNRSIHSNGIRRCFATHQKLRSAYRDIRTEVELQTDGGVNLDYVMRQYRQAWTFFRDNLYRRANPERVAMEILSYCYPPFSYATASVPARMSYIIESSGRTSACLSLFSC